MKRILLPLLLTVVAFTSIAAEPDFTRFRAEEGTQWQILWNQDATIRSLYGRGSRSYSSAEFAVESFLSNYSSLFGIQNRSDLRAVSVERTEAGTDFIFQQYYEGLPVVGGIVSIHTDPSNRIIGATSEYKKNLTGNFSLPDTLQMARESAHAITGGIAAPQRDLALLDTGDHALRPVWSIEVDSARFLGGSWQVYVDARRPNYAYFLKKTYADFDGTGNVWPQNPIVTPVRQFETLSYMDDSTKLSGKYTIIYDANSTHTVFEEPLDLSTFTTASDPSRHFDFPEGDARLTETMAYFHINRVHDQWRKFGFHRLNARAPIFVNVAEKEGGPGFDNAFYSRSFQFRRTGIYVFGAGDFLRNLGLDSDVYYHEYGHGVLDHTKPHFFLSIENNYAAAFHEGFADISAAAITENSKMGEYALRLKSGKFIGRNLNNHKRFPQDVIRPGLDASEPHYTSLIVSGAWWDVEQKIGSLNAQQLIFKSLSLLPSRDIDFFDFRDAMLAADENVNDGKNRDTITSAFDRHGLSGEDPGQPGVANVTSLKTARWNLNTGVKRIAQTFKKGQYILGVIGYTTSSNLTPGYNFVPVDAEISGPCKSCVTVVTFTDEARKGTFANAEGAIQVLLITHSAVSGTYTLSVKSRLGGTEQVSNTVITSFKIR